MPAKFLHICFIFLVFPYTLCARDYQTDSLLHLIDEAVNRSGEYIAQKEKRITLLRNDFQKAHDKQTAYHVAFKLYEEYRPFINDSAIYYLNRCIALATALGNQQRVGLCRSWLALRCSNSGMYNEALDILKLVNADEMDENARGIYYFAYVLV